MKLESKFNIGDIFIDESFNQYKIVGISLNKCLEFTYIIEFVNTPLSNSEYLENEIISKLNSNDWKLYENEYNISIITEFIKQLKTGDEFSFKFENEVFYYRFLQHVDYRFYYFVIMSEKEHPKTKELTHEELMYILLQANNLSEIKHKGE